MTEAILNKREQNAARTREKFSYLASLAITTPVRMPT
jgi:hypothetical protein